MPGQPKFFRARPRGYSPDPQLDGSAWTGPLATIVDRFGTTVVPSRDGDIASSVTNTAAAPLFGVANTSPLAAFQPRIDTASNYLAGFDGANGRLWKWDPLTYHDITPAAWTKVGANEYTGGMLNGYLYLANGVEAPVTHDWVNTNVATQVAGWYTGPTTTVPRWISSFKDFLIIGALKETGPTAFLENQVRWSDRSATGVGLPTAWDATSVNEAGRANIGDISEVLYGRALGDEFLVYKHGSIWRMVEAGLPEVFQVKPGITTAGAMSRNCVVEKDGLHFVVGETDIYKTDGRQAQSVATREIRRKLLDDMAPSRREETYAFFNPEHNELWVCYAQSGADYCNQVLTFNGDKWGSRIIGQAETGEAGTDGYPHIFSGTAQLAGRFRPIGLDPGAAAGTGKQRIISSSVQELDTNSVSTTLLCMVEPAPGKQSVVRRIWPIVRGAPDTVTLSFDAVGADTTDFDEFSTTFVGDDFAVGEPISTDARGRYILVRAVIDGNSSVLADTVIDGFDIEYTDGGRF